MRSVSPEAFPADSSAIAQIGAVRKFLCTAFLMLTPSMLSATTQDQTPYTLQVNSRVVLTDVTVTDSRGNPVEGLSPEDFLIFDDGKPQKLASFEEHRQQMAKPVKASVERGLFSNDYLQHPPPQVNVILFDTTTIGIVDQMYLFQQMKRFVDNLPAGEPVAVFTRWGDVAVQLASFTDDHDALMRAIRRAIPRLQQPGSWMASDLDTLQQMANYLRQVQGRKNLIWFSGGSSLFLSPNPTFEDFEARREIYDTLEAERIAIYPIDARGLMVIFGFQETMALGSQQILMRQDAAATGGAAYVNTNGLAQAAQHIVSTDGKYYTLTYSPKDLKNDGKWHLVKVKVSRPGCQLSYRQGYFDDRSNEPGAPGKTKTAMKADGKKIEIPNGRSEPIVFTAQVKPAPVGLAPAAGDPPLKRGEQRYLVRYVIPARDVFPADVHGNVETDVMDSAVLVFDHDGEPVQKRGQKVTLNVDEAKKRSIPNAEVVFIQTLNLPRGRNYLYLAVWDTVTGRLGTMSAEVEVGKAESN